MEHFSFHAGQGEDRHIDQRDDGHAEQRRPDDFGSGAGCHRETLLTVKQPAQPVLFLAKPSQAVFDDDDGAVHNQTKIQRTQAHQVSGHAATHHASDRHQHSDRDHRRRNQGRADIPQQQEQHHNDQQCAFGQVLRYRADRAIYQIGSVIDGNGFDPRRQRLGRQRQPFGCRIRHHAAVLTRPHQDSA